MPTVGRGQVARLQLPTFDATTLAELTLVGPPDADGVRPETELGASSTDDNHTWTADVPPYQRPGRWYHVWTVTGTGAGRIVNPVDVEPDPIGAAGRRAYATTADLANWIHAAPPDDAERMLADATREVDGLLVCAVYPVDADGEPTDAKHRAALRDAVCEQVAWWIDTGDPSGAVAIYGSLSAGSISVGRATAAAARGADARVAPGVRQILAGAGLLGHAPRVRG
jgi:hypothetical protein